MDVLAHEVAGEEGLGLRLGPVFQRSWFGSTKTLDVHIAAVRRRLADAAHAVAIATPEISTLRGHGYRLEE